MAFEYASVTKGLMFALALTSIAAGIFDLKHYLNLQLVPHISKHHQYWRLPVHSLVCASSSDLLLTELLLYNVGIPTERAFGSVKFASFFVISAFTTILVTFLALLLSQLTNVSRALFNNVPPGPIAIMFAVLYQYIRLVPSAYRFRVFGLAMSDKIWVYAVAVQLALARLPASLLPMAVGLFAGYLYRSEYFLQLKAWRISPSTVRLAEAWIKPLLGHGAPVRRTNRVLPEPRGSGTGTTTTSTTAHQNSSAGQQDEDEEAITTTRARRRLPSRTDREQQQQPQPQQQQQQQHDGSSTGASANVVRQWMTELASGTRPAPAPGGGTVRVPGEGEVALLSAMFPDVDREVLLGVSQRSPNIEAAAETLLASRPAS